MTDTRRPEELLALCSKALAAARSLAETARKDLSERLAPQGKPDPAALQGEQFAAHGLAWLATTVEALAQLLAWARDLEERGGGLDEIEALILELGFAEYLAQIAGGIPLGQSEIVRPADLGLDAQALAAFATPEVRALTGGKAAALRQRLAGLIAERESFGRPAAVEGELAIMRGELRRLAGTHAAGAQDWHRKDILVPLEVIQELADFGVFGVTVPEDFGGLGLGKLAMAVVSEELSRGALVLGSLGTRSEIASELIKLSGTDAQKRRWLPGIASGEILPTAVFTEPGSGSDLAAIATRAERDGDTYRIHGAKTWITHGGRSDIMTLLVRTGSRESGHRGLSMFIAEKPRGSESEPFPAEGLSGSEIPVIGYRGLKEYEIAFDGFAVPADCLLGETEGEGFRQLMATFESARIQTAARAVGVAQNALELGLAYARERRQFGQAILAYPRVAGKLAWTAVEIMIARQLTYHAAREKDRGRRSDVVAGMAKLLGARVAWAAADSALQVHGGNGYAEEYPISRVLLDARILNIFEGAAEIQAQVIARGLLTPGRN
ncbi:MAG: acyl-CoA dehydrogenase family protein [Rhodovibrionaceae bacterium]